MRPLRGSSLRRALPALAALAVLAAVAASPALAGERQAPRRQLAQGITATMPPLDVLVSQFEHIAFSNEFGGEHRRGRIVKWITPIRVAIRGSNADAYEGDVLAMIAQLKRLTGLDIALAGWLEAGAINFEIEFGGTIPAKLRATGAACATYIDDQNFAITRVRIVISGNIAALRKHCIVEELTQALGLADDSDIIYPSIFSDASHQQGLYPWDEIMLMTLYHPRLKTGMRRSQARPIVRAVLSQLVSQMPATTHDTGPPKDGN